MTPWERTNMTKFYFFNSPSAEIEITSEQRSLRFYKYVLGDALGVTILFKKYQDMNNIFRVIEYCYSAVLYFFSAVIALNLPFPSQIASHQFTHPVSILPYIHSFRKSFALGSHCPPACCSPPPELSLLLVLSSREWRWHLPSECYRKGTRGGQKRKLCLQWEI